jgi:hypothetical protein
MTNKWRLGLAPVYCMVLQGNVLACELALAVCLDLPLVWFIMSDIMQLRHIRWKENKYNEAKRGFLYFNENLISFSSCSLLQIFKIISNHRVFGNGMLTFSMSICFSFCLNVLVQTAVYTGSAKRWERQVQSIAHVTLVTAKVVFLLTSAYMEDA